jgi:hypothetical protein
LLSCGANITRVHANPRRESPQLHALR